MNKIRRLERNHWKIQFSWVKAHIGITGNELADKLAKETSADKQIQITYNKVPKSAIPTKFRESALQQWQRRWNNTIKGALTKSFFPTVTGRLKLHLSISPEFTAIVTGHGKARYYLHRFHIIDDPSYTCNRAEQTINHLIYQCQDKKEQRLEFIKQIRNNGGTWPVTNHELVAKHLQAFSKFAQSLLL